MSQPLLLIAFLYLAGGNEASVTDYRQWVEQDVAYIMSKTEREEFSTLQSDQERAEFVEAFWQKRDPDPATEENPFRDEHYRRLEFAQKHFADGRQGWRTDRGRIYIIHGEPDRRLVFAGEELQRKRELELTDRTLDQGAYYSGVTIAIPEAELWTYYARGAPDRIREHTDILFMRVNQDDVLQLLTVNRPGRRVIDRNEFFASGLYRGHGGAGKDFRIVYAGRPRFSSNVDFYRLLEQDPNSFQAAEMTLAQADLLRSPGDLLERELQLRRQLRETVQTAVFFEEFPMSLETWFLPAERGYTQIPLAIHVPGAAVSGSPRLAVLIEARRGQRVVAQVVDELELTQDARTAHEGTIYQTRLAVRPGPHELQVHLLDRTQGRRARVVQNLNVPSLSADTFSLSPMILCGRVENVKSEAPRVVRRSPAGGPWRMDQWLLSPQPGREFRRKDVLTAFFEIYAPALDGERPRVEVELQLLKDGLEFAALESRELEYLTLGESPRLAYALSLSLSRLPRGNYQLVVRARDVLANQTAEQTESFEVL